MKRGQRGTKARMGAWLASGVVAMVLGLGLSAGPAAARTELTWYGQAAFKVVTPNGGVFLIDPWLDNPKNPDKAAVAKLDRVDYILITHGHGDHVGNAVDIARQTGAQLVTTAGLNRALQSVYGYPKELAGFDTSGNVGGRISLPKVGAHVTIVNAVHGSSLGTPKPAAGENAVTTGGNPVGLVIEIEGGPTLYHTGDTDVFTDMKLIDEFFDVDVMLACIGDHFTMGPSRAALAVDFVKPKRVVPMHYGTFPLLSGTPAALQREMAKRGVKAELVAMSPGDTRSF